MSEREGVGRAIHSRVVVVVFAGFAVVREWNPLPLAKMGRGRERERGGELSFGRRAALAVRPAAGRVCFGSAKTQPRLNVPQILNATVAAAV